jgi:dipeptidase D
MGNILGSLKPEVVWNHFEEICNYPRPSRKEDKIASYVVSVGKRNNLETLRDEFGNVLIRKPAVPGKENLTPVVLQGHLDMVAEKNNDVKHDFIKDPITPYIDGDWVKAKGTTLGSDNGIGVAAALAVLESKDIDHGPLEAVFTLDEETGLFGAQALKPGFLKSSILLNLDSEEDGTLYIGCAGGQNTIAKIKYNQKDVPGNTFAIELKVTGLKGGHSGLDIITGRGNAIKLIVRLLHELNYIFGIRLVNINGGSKHNAIPRECSAVIRAAKKSKEDVLNYVESYNQIVKSELASVEHNLNVTAVEIKSRAKVIDKSSSANLVNSLYAVPNGVIKMSADIEGLVETSTNLAVVVTKSKTIEITLSQRSSVESERNDISNAISSLFNLAKAEVSHVDGYPGWKPNIHSPVLSVLKSVYKDLYGSEPEVKAIHAGLECGIINERYPDMDMISFGPTIIGAHSPDEKVQISTVSKFWDLLVNVLKNIPQN